VDKPAVKQREGPDEEARLQRQELRQVEEFKKREELTMLAALTSSPGSLLPSPRQKNHNLGSCAVCEAHLNARIGVFTCEECAGHVCAAVSCSWHALGRCKNCTPRLLEKAMAAAEHSSFWSGTPLDTAKAQEDFKRDLREAKYLKHDPDTGTHMTRPRIYTLHTSHSHPTHVTGRCTNDAVAEKGVIFFGGYLTSPQSDQISELVRKAATQEGGKHTIPWGDGKGAARNASMLHLQEEADDPFAAWAPRHLPHEADRNEKAALKVPLASADDASPPPLALVRMLGRKTYKDVCHKSNLTQQVGEYTASANFMANHTHSHIDDARNLGAGAHIVVLGLRGEGQMVFTPPNGEDGEEEAVLRVVSVGPGDVVVLFGDFR
jgi:hypothetical protein